MTKKTYGALAAQKKRLERHFNGLPLKDAPFKVAFQVTDEDLANASPADPEQCAVARCFRRTYQASTAIILRRVAYIELADEKGDPTVYRFIVPPRTLNKVIKPLDLGTPAEPGTYYLNAVPSSDGLGNKAAYMRKRHKMLQDGNWKPAPRGVAHHKPRERHLPGEVGILRDGQGLIHNTTT